MSSPPLESEPLRLPDLTTCDREPIHTPGAIEPHGGLLVVGDTDLVIQQVSANTMGLFGIAPEALPGMHLQDFLAQADVQRLTSGTLSDGKRRYVGGIRIRSSQALFDGLAHRHRRLLIIELEPSFTPSETLANFEIYSSLTDAMAELDGPQRLTELCGRIATRIRYLTDFDRVMVYRFLQDDSGSVIAEARREDLVPYLGLRYPASDIPAQARRLYLLNTLRLKPDVNAGRVALVPAVNPSTGTALDMTFCILRAMSPIHDEYLRNMGVTASMSISIIRDDRLWGLIACHHGQPKLVPHPMRITCEVLARVFSSHIAAAEEEDQRTRVAATRSLTNHITERLRKERDLAGTLADEEEAIRKAIGAAGAAICVGGKISLTGQAPDAEQVSALLAWLSVNQQEQLFATERLTDHYPTAQEFSHRLSGLLSARIAFGSHDFILLFRPAVIQVIDWAGNPGKPVEQTEAGKRISPRLSFELWKQTVQDSSEPWDETDREFALSLRQVIAEALLLESNEEILRLNAEMSRSNIELDAFAYSASHDLQEPVRMIRSYAQLLARRAGPNLPAETRELISVIENSATRMGGLITALLSYSQLGGAERRETKPLSLEDVLRWVMTDLSEAVRESKGTFTHDTLPVVIGNHDQMVQLLQNLISNAIKYRRPNESLHVHVSAELQEGFWLLSVRDNGQGFDPMQSEVIFGAFKRLHGREIPGSGIGLATCKRIVELHGGGIWAESAGKDRGATFRFTLPGSSSRQQSDGRDAS